MSARSFRSVFMVASCAGAALGCYMVSLRVASERAELEDVETRIVLAQRDMRVLQTEIGTRGRLSQLERWNARVLALSAPEADQFVSGGFELAKLAQPEHRVDFHAPVVLAAAPAPEAHKAPLGQGETDDAGAPTGVVPAGVAPTALLHEASLKTQISRTETREVPEKPAAKMPLAAGPHPGNRSIDKPATAAKLAFRKSVDKPGLAAAKPSKSVDKSASSKTRTVTKPVRLAKNDPLAPLPEKHSAHQSPKDQRAAR